MRKLERPRSKCVVDLLDGEIEITTDMIEAGAAELEKFYLGNGRYDLREAALKAVFHSMEKLRPLRIGPQIA
jgi:hypothetical protein